MDAAGRSGVSSRTLAIHLSLDIGRHPAAAQGRMTRIVVIDDRVTNRNILTRLALSVEEGLQVSAYASPVEALDALDGGLACDLIITDYNMPEMDGASFVRTLRQRGEHHD